MFLMTGHFGFIDHTMVYLIYASLLRLIYSNYLLHGHLTPHEAVWLTVRLQAGTEDQL